MGALKRASGIMVASLLLGSATGAALELSQPRVYEARAQIRVGSASSGSTSVSSARRLSVVRAALAASRLDPASGRELLLQSSVERAADRRLTFSVRLADRARADLLATAYARAYLEALPASRARGARITPARGAAALRRPLAATALGAALGLAVGLVLALALETLDRRRRRSSRQLAHRLALRQLGTVPRPPHEVERSGGLVMLDSPRGIGASPFLGLGREMLDAASAIDAQVIIFAGATGQEDAPVVAANLGLALAQTGSTVVLADLDFARPSLRRRFALPRRPGLSDLLAGKAPYGEVLYMVPLPSRSPGRSSEAEEGSDAARGSLHVLPIGQATPSAGARLGRTVAALRKRAEIVLLASSPLLTWSEPPQELSQADGLVLVVDLAGMRRSDGFRLEASLRKVACPVLGLIVLTPGPVGSGVGEHARRPADRWRPASRPGGQRRTRRQVRTIQTRDPAATTSRARNAGLPGSTGIRPSGVSITGEPAPSLEARAARTSRRSRLSPSSNAARATTLRASASVKAARRHGASADSATSRRTPRLSMADTRAELTPTARATVTRRRGPPGP